MIPAAKEAEAKRSMLLVSLDTQLVQPCQEKINILVQACESARKEASATAEGDGTGSAHDRTGDGPLLQDLLAVIKKHSRSIDDNHNNDSTQLPADLFAGIDEEYDDEGEHEEKPEDAEEVSDSKRKKKTTEEEDDVIEKSSNKKTSPPTTPVPRKKPRKD
jgi:hypothetical protein